MNPIIIHATHIRSSDEIRITIYDTRQAKDLGIALTHSSLWRDVRATREVEKEVTL